MTHKSLSVLSSNFNYLEGMLQKDKPGKSIKKSYSYFKKEVKHHLELEKASSEIVFDVIVLGVGSMGSATCYYLSKQGYKVLGLEQFSIPHELGSHAGQSRIIRKAYYEQPAYVPLLKKAYQNWKELEEMTGIRVYYKTGLLYFGEPENELMKAIHESADQYSITLKKFSEQGIRKTFPQFAIPDKYERLFEPDAGFLTPERAVTLYVHQSLQRGADIRSNEKVIRWEKKKDHIRVKTKKGIYRSKKLIITAGPWAGQSMPSIKSKLTVTRQVLAWVKPKKLKPFHLNHFPCWMIMDKSKSGLYYGFPIVPARKFDGPFGLKLSHHYPGKICHPDTVNRNVSKSEYNDLKYVLEKYIPEGFDSFNTIKTCLYTNTPDEDFILDFLPTFENDVLMAAGFSGHGFKFASVVGEIMADLAMKGKTDLPIDFLRIKRLFK